MFRNIYIFFKFKNFTSTTSNSASTYYKRNVNNKSSRNLKNKSVNNFHHSILIRLCSHAPKSACWGLKRPPLGTDHRNDDDVSPKKSAFTLNENVRKWNQRNEQPMTFGEREEQRGRLCVCVCMYKEKHRALEIRQIVQKNIMII